MIQYLIHHVLIFYLLMYFSSIDSFVIQRKNENRIPSIRIIYQQIQTRYSHPQTTSSNFLTNEFFTLDTKKFIKFTRQNKLLFNRYQLLKKFLEGYLLKIFLPIFPFILFFEQMIFHGMNYIME